MPVFAWRGQFRDAELNALHATEFGIDTTNTGWWERVNRHSPGWVCAHEAARLIGFLTSSTRLKLVDSNLGVLRGGLVR